ncbi:hypothetical protein RND71_022070 [Anisodus tanguticus]|uniref:Uncharacterized protein n=1 Tax=Anisodus tanguticus TaxID=243964 RepID=A0AAE1RZP1_9SOLA|nr:hypothetical protein RND71_022070 [Anisodus tanguticus]
MTALFLSFQQFCDGKVMMEYIGATGKPITFDDVPIDDGIDFHLILSFAIDADPSGNPQNGKFSPYYEVDGRGIQGDAFFYALRLLGSNGFHVNGAMIFSADASAEDNYYYERKHKHSCSILLVTTRNL